MIGKFAECDSFLPEDGCGKERKVLSISGALSDLVRSQALNSQTGWIDSKLLFLETRRVRKICSVLQSRILGFARIGTNDQAPSLLPLPHPSSIALHSQLSALVQSLP